MTFKNLNETPSGAQVLAGAKPLDLSQVLTAERVAKYTVAGARGWTYNFAAKSVDDSTLKLLQKLSEEMELVGKYRLLLDGEMVNTGEKRKVLHQLTRGQLGKDVVENGKNIRKFYQEQQERAYAFAGKVHRGELKGSTGKAFDTVVQIGIGGSDLGPRALYLALESYQKLTQKAQKMKAAFISNVDPDDANLVLSGLNLESCLFVLVSKSGTTQETLANELFVKKVLTEKGLDPKKHFVAVTSETSPLAGNPAYLDSFYIDDYIGGRYSSTSGVGGVVLTLAFGKEVFAEFLAGAHEADKTALETDILKNPALLDALIGVWERNALGYPMTAVLPYSQALSRFPAHLQQLDMESNGKSVNREGKPVNYATGPVIFGEPGTNGQHSFYQHLHQGKDIVPIQFIGFADSQVDYDIEVEGSTSQTKLKANLAAQIVAFAKGSKNDNPNKNFDGGRPSSLLMNRQLTPGALGALLAHFENKVMFQGFAWNINSFDQEGVQLGKVLTKAVLAKGSMDGALKAYADLLKV